MLVATDYVHRDGRLLNRAEYSRWQKERWIAKRATEPDDGMCRDWPWALNNKGCGVVRWGGPVAKVGHVVLIESGQPRPVGMMQRHLCDRPVCAARWHLRWGTATENNGDKRRSLRLRILGRPVGEDGSTHA